MVFSRINLLNRKESSAKLVVIAKGFLKLPNLHMPIKKEFMTSQKLLSFWWIANSVLNKSKSAIPPLFNSPELSSSSDKGNLFTKSFSKNSNLDDFAISLPVFHSRTKLKLHISVTPKMVNKVIMSLDSSKASGRDCIPVLVLKNCEPELSFILAEHFNKCLKESCFQIVGSSIGVLCI